MKIFRKVKNIFSQIKTIKPKNIAFIETKMGGILDLE
jgi:hypothetical protein